MEKPFNATCKHFGICGGCSFQDIDYSKQVSLKEERIKELTYKYNFSNIEIKPFNTFSEWFYRNKMEFTFSDDNGLVLGLHSRSNKRKVFNVEECLIFSPDVSFILETIRRFCRSKGYAPYNKFTHRGFLRHLILRQTKFTSEIMIGIVTTSECQLDEDGLLKSLLKEPIKDMIKSVYWIINDSWGDAVVFDKKKLLYRSPFITERLDRYLFNIDIDTFFQINSYGIRALYSRIKDYVSLYNVKKAFDLYCGVGCVGIFLSTQLKVIYGVELSFSSIKIAKTNASLNNIDNVFFVCEDVRKFLANTAFRGNIDLIVVNPPRCGLSKKIKKRIMGVEAPYIFYSACNPNTLFADLHDLKHLYTPLFFEPFDFFPHTRHFEIFVVLKKQG